jgi:DNA (cytosine-5)-methyltransferase 1
MNIRAIDLFCGAGGISEGLSESGVDIVAAVDYMDWAVDTHEENHPDCLAVQEDLSEIPPKEFFEKYDLDEDEIDFVAGSPPCQGFSNANYERNIDDERNNLVYGFVDYVQFIEPRYIMMENVPGIKTLDDGSYVAEIYKALTGSGYNVNFGVINTADYGVPQERNRFLLIGDKEDEATFPEPTHSEDEYVTVEEAFEGIPEIGVGEKSDKIPNHRGSNHQQKTVDKIAKTDWGETIPYENWGQKTRLHPEEPSPTLLAGKRINFHKAHPNVNRGLTVRERARIQSFPDDYKFKGNLTEQKRQTGNAFPPRAAQKIGSHLLDEDEEGISFNTDIGHKKKINQYVDD